MRILQVHTEYREPGGEESVARAEAALLRSAGHEVVEHWVPNPSAAAPSAAAFLRSPWNSGAARRVRSRALEARVDLAHVHNTWFSQSPAVVSELKRQGLPVVATLHNYRLLCLNASLFRDGRQCFECVGSSPLPGVLHRCYRGSAALSAVAAAGTVYNRFRRTWQEVDLFLVPTDSARQVLEVAGLQRDRMLVKPHFTADPGPRPDPPSASAEVLFVGRLAPGKGIECLLDAWREAAIDRFRLTVVGDGPLRLALEDRNTPGVSFVGRMSSNEVRARMLSARALIFPSVWLEPFGMVLIEAMASGLAVVASDVGGTSSILGPGGLVVPPGDPSALAGAIRLLEDDPTVDAAGSRARERYQRKFTPAVNLSLLENIYSSVAG